ncbi:amidohydrolase [Bacteroidota bacterium]
MNKLIHIIIVLLLFNTACKKMEHVDLIIKNAKIYTVDSAFSQAECIAVKDGKFVAVGSQDDILKKYNPDSILDMEGKFIYPGFIDAHCHFYGYGAYKQTVDLYNTSSYDELLKRVLEFADKNKHSWIRGRGWDQNLWEIKEFPDNKKLNVMFPNTPVMLIRVDGHAVLINEAAMKLVEFDQRKYADYMIFRDGRFTGVLLDNAADLFKDAASIRTNEEIAKALLIAQEDCFAVGLTGVSDAGLNQDVIQSIIHLNAAGKLNMHIYAMLNPNKENEDFINKHGVYRTDFLHIQALKLYADGALGSRGACLIDPYSDDPENTGKILDTDSFYQYYCEFALKNDYQICTHAIGDSANRYILKLYSQFLSPGNDKRWRIEHSQVIHPSDFALFGAYSIVPSVQPTHATSDMNWAKDRLGDERVQFAYAYQSLLKQNHWIPFGSDFPVESINPLFGYYAAIARKDINGKPPEGFQVKEALNLEDALRAMTIWAAKANFEEHEKGSIEKGKLADFVVLDRDILSVSEAETHAAIVLKTFISGKEVFSR